MMARNLRNMVGASVLTLALGGLAAQAEEVKLPQTADDHMAMAKSYEEKAAAWRNEAAYHREMAAAYRKSHADFKGGVRNPWTVKMEQHCMTFVKDADKLAADAEELAKYHRLRAQEVQGK